MRILLAKLLYHYEQVTSHNMAGLVENSYNEYGRMIYKYYSNSPDCYIKRSKK